MDVKVTKLDGEVFFLSDYNITAKDFLVSSIELNSEYGSVSGRSGVIDYGSEYGQRSIEVPFYFKSDGLSEYALLRDELYGKLNVRDSFYIEEMRRSEFQTGENKLIGGKRYLVRLSNVISPEQTFLYGEGSLEFETSELPFAESVGTSSELDGRDIDYNDEIWGFGMGLSLEEGATDYTHTSNSFRIYNASNINIHPFEHDFKIEISGVSGADFELYNGTTGDSFIVTDTLKSTDVVTLEGPEVKINGLQALRKTNRKFIGLAKGWNVFKTNRNAKVKFDVRFYYV